jgi:hypothetical protein
MTEPTNRALKSLKDLQSPTLDDRERVRGSLQRTLAAGATPESARRVLEAMQHSATRGATAWLTSKWVVSAALIGASAVGTAYWSARTTSDTPQTRAPSIEHASSTAVHPQAQSAVVEAVAVAPTEPINAATEASTEAVLPPARASSTPRARATRTSARHNSAAREEATTTVSIDAIEEAPSPAAAPAPVAQPNPVVKAAIAPEVTTVNAAKAPSIHLAEELALLGRADAALRDKNASAALNALSDHAMRFPESALRTERVGLRAIALCMQDDPYAARARDAFLNDHGTSPLASRVRNACVNAHSEMRKP